MTNSSNLQLDMSELVEKMNGVNSTNGWDVVASYSVKELNAFIHDQYHNIDTERIIFTQCIQIAENKLTIEYSFVLSCPTLSFFYFK